MGQVQGQNEIFYEDEVFSRGIFAVPHGIFDMTSGKHSYISKSAGILLVVLLHFENRKTTKPGIWFDCDKREICNTKFISEGTLVEARNCLKEHGLIDVKVGGRNRDTYYKINIKPEYYYKKWFQGKNLRGGQASS